VKGQRQVVVRNARAALDVLREGAANKRVGVIVIVVVAVVGGSGLSRCAPLGFSRARRWPRRS
jgi:hypothetical protein